MTDLQRRLIIKYSFTPRQAQVAELVSKGLTNRAVADKLNVTEQAVKFHLTNIFKRSGLGDRIKLSLTIYKMNGHRA